MAWGHLSASCLFVTHKCQPRKRANSNAQHEYTAASAMQPAFSLPDWTMLRRDGGVMEQGKGANVLGDRLSALHYFLKELRG